MLGEDEVQFRSDLKQNESFREDCERNQQKKVKLIDIAITVLIMTIQKIAYIYEILIDFRRFKGNIVKYVKLRLI